PMDVALLDREVDLAPNHRHRVRAEGLERLDEGGNGRNTDRLALEIVGRLHRALVREHAAETPAAAVAEWLGAERLEPAHQLLTDGPFMDPPPLLATPVEGWDRGGAPLLV